ncbi:MAG: DUF983 domain-containing protein [Gemmatimonadetes bacterium]|nr:DUF983 domain-containing protein [Gemmatimonadota bacterium]MBP9105889.1 DUF983 domain-containing protein [Gemmatimonadaceae bacterium]MBK6458087.1 DUF983 domain-containing protein [Gemmatimonadota bacterium]MBK6844437.1 DUF983 domain-containing protein [Gemmatimonadota bacterium]MBK7832266.1 DUF983 domain-containing protein [Gemmatimonadota bacterium]
MGNGTGDGRGELGGPSAPGPRALRDDNEHLDLSLPGLGRILVLVGRALTLHCPHCGKGPVLVNWFRLRPACGHCTRALERGEPDYFLGGMMFNLILAELLFAGIFVAVLVFMWPTVPWDGISIGAPVGMALAPILLYPISKLVWLAFDLSFRPEQDS